MIIDVVLNMFLTERSVRRRVRRELVEARHALLDAEAAVESSTRALQHAKSTAAMARVREARLAESVLNMQPKPHPRPNPDARQPPYPWPEPVSRVQRPADIPSPLETHSA